jgi:hypothetical protein
MVLQSEVIGIRLDHGEQPELSLAAPLQEIAGAGLLIEESRSSRRLSDRGIGRGASP